MTLMSVVIVTVFLPCCCSCGRAVACSALLLLESPLSLGSARFARLHVSAATPALRVIGCRGAPLLLRLWLIARLVVGRLQARRKLAQAGLVALEVPQQGKIIGIRDPILIDDREH